MKKPFKRHIKVVYATERKFAKGKVFISNSQIILTLTSKGKLRENFNLWRSWHVYKSATGGKNVKMSGLLSQHSSFQNIVYQQEHNGLKHWREQTVDAADSKIEVEYDLLSLISKCIRQVNKFSFRNRISFTLKYQ